MLAGALCGAVDKKILKSMGESGLLCRTPSIGVIVLHKTLSTLILIFYLRGMIVLVL